MILHLLDKLILLLIQVLIHKCSVPADVPTTFVSKSSHTTQSSKCKSFQSRAPSTAFPLQIMYMPLNFLPHCQSPAPSTKQLWVFNNQGATFCLVSKECRDEEYGIELFALLTQAHCAEAVNHTRPGCFIFLSQKDLNTNTAHWISWKFHDCHLLVQKL